MASAEMIWSFLIAVLLGFLVGLERERKREDFGSIFAGVRTFPLIGLFGALIGNLSTSAGSPIVVSGFLVLGALLALAYWRQSAGDKVGGTSEIAALVTFGLGIVAGKGEFAAALAGAVITTGVLSLRQELRLLVGAITREDLFAIVQFAAVSLIILPLVPDRGYGPWAVWNPRTIWLLVVLISGISFVGYVAVKVIGTRRGIGLSSLLGGLASSTAVTLTFSERSRQNPTLGRILAVGAVAASAVAAPRLLILLGVVESSLVVPALVPLGTLFVVTTAIGLVILRGGRDPGIEATQLDNPFRLRIALQFGVLFAVVLFVARAAEALLGASGVYLASVLAGITQLDAIALSLAQQVGNGLDHGTATRGLALAVASNAMFKATLAMILGSRSFGRAVLITLLIAAAFSVAAAWFLVPLLPQPIVSPQPTG